MRHNSPYGKTVAHINLAQKMLKSIEDPANRGIRYVMCFFLMHRNTLSGKSLKELFSSINLYAPFSGPQKVSFWWI